MMLRVALARSTTLVALLTFPFGVTPATAQQDEEAQEQATQKQIEQADAPDTGETDTALTEDAMGGPDAVVVTVGDAEIFGSDVMRAIGALPQPMREQPAELLLPMALQQLVLRELILERARSEKLADDPDFAEMAEQANAQAEENALVQFWLEREMADATSDAAVNTAYEQITRNSQGDVPPLEMARPQIEQELQRRAMTRIRADLQAQGPEITFAGQSQGETGYGDGSFCTIDYAPQGDAAQRAGSEFAEMDLDGDGMVSQQEYAKCRTAAAGE